MIHLPMNSKRAVDANTLHTLNQSFGISQDMSISAMPSNNPPHPQNNRPVFPSSERRPLPLMKNTIQKGQKISIETGGPLHKIKACFGWNTKNPTYDIDASAFLLGPDGKVPGDAWFVFYGQTESPDKSVSFHKNETDDRECISIHFDQLNYNIQKIVFVLTIHEALEKNLNFGMIADAYLRILNMENKSELVSYKLEEYYSNVISMMIGELYRHNGVWKFGAIGNGVARDLAGLCALYGVDVTD